jgi:hypothetical protein
VHRGAMEHHDKGRALDPAEVAIASERASIEAAIALVASGRVTSVTLAGMRLGDVLLPEAERYAGRRHVRVRPLWPMGDGPIDLIIEAEPRGA